MIDEAIDFAYAELPFIVQVRNDVFEARHTEQLVEFLIDDCGKEPIDFMAKLNHLPPDVYDTYGGRA